MDISYMREKISKVYEGPRWKEKVKRMPDNQVMAIYFNFKERGIFDKPEVKKLMDIPEEVQISIWDIMKGEQSGKDVHSAV